MKVVRSGCWLQQVVVVRQFLCAPLGVLVALVEQPGVLAEVTVPMMVVEMVLGFGG